MMQRGNSTGNPLILLKNCSKDHVKGCFPRWDFLICYRVCFFVQETAEIICVAIILGQIIK